jgi:hypothetical protein
MMLIAVSLGPACTRGHAPVDLSDFDQVRQVAVDHGLVCGKESLREGRRQVGCTLGDTTIIVTMGDHYDGLGALRLNHPTCPDRTYSTDRHFHGQIWAGDGYYISLFNFGPSDELERALSEDLGTDPACELTTPPPPFG